MKLNHLNLVVDDLAAATALFIDLFDFSLIRSGGEMLAILSDQSGFTLVLMNAHRDGPTGDPIYPAGFHIGFILPSREDVDAMHARVSAYGIPLGQTPARSHGDYGFYFTALNGILFEIAA
jgi:catechol 2,3-dioxygenase-like lactoylglutathione lyase family enzyme